MPACTDYSPVKRNKAKINISFGQKILEALKDHNPAPNTYKPDTTDIQAYVRSRIKFRKPMGPPELKPRLF